MEEDICYVCKRLKKLSDVYNSIGIPQYICYDCIKEQEELNKHRLIDKIERRK